ncbi:MAG: recombination-associated protein RdgC, partial [Methylococcales bacterium]|nr:recombination-associated protein RdgC [Methylococcales bacterium]
MWFKNLIFYRFVTPFTLSDEALAEQLSDKAFQLCGPLDHFSQGWSAPLGAKHDQLTFTTSHCTMVCMRKEEKVLPAAVVKEFVGSKVSDIEEQQMRKVGRKEREDIKDEILHDLLPRAFTRSAYTYAYIDRQNGWMIVDSASQKKADDLTTLLRKTLGSLAIELPTTNDMPTACMTHWLKEGNLPTGLNIEDECELKSPDENG